VSPWVQPSAGTGQASTFYLLCSLKPPTQRATRTHPDGISSPLLLVRSPPAEGSAGLASWQPPVVWPSWLGG